MDVLSAVIGAVGTVLLGVLGWYSRFFIVSKREGRADAESNQDVRQSDQAFLFDHFRKLLKEHERNYSALKEEFATLRNETTVEIHDLRNKLQECLIAGAVLKTEKAQLLQDLAALKGEG